MPSIYSPQNFIQTGSHADALELSTSLAPTIDHRADLLENRDRLRLILVGSAESVTRTRQILDCLGFAQLHRWSQLVAAPEQLNLQPLPGEVLSVLTRYRQQG